MRSTCNGCQHLKLNNLAGMIVTPSCTGSDTPDWVVPHHAEHADVKGEFKLTYWRIPTTCPLPDGEVVKSDKKAPMGKWEIMIVDITDVEEIEL